MCSTKLIGDVNGDRSNTLSGSYSKSLWRVTVIKCQNWLWWEQTSVLTQMELHPCTVDIIAARDWAHLGFPASWWNCLQVKLEWELGKLMHWTACGKQLCRVSCQNRVHDRRVGWRDEIPEWWDDKKRGDTRDSDDWLLGSLTGQWRDTGTARGFGWAASRSVSLWTMVGSQVEQTANARR